MGGHRRNRLHRGHRDPALRLEPGHAAKPAKGGFHLGQLGRRRRLGALLRTQLIGGLHSRVSGALRHDRVLDRVAEHLACGARGEHARDAAVVAVAAAAGRDVMGRPDLLAHARERHALGDLRDE